MLIRRFCPSIRPSPAPLRFYNCSSGINGGNLCFINICAIVVACGQYFDGHKDDKTGGDDDGSDGRDAACVLCVSSDLCCKHLDFMPPGRSCRGRQTNNKCAGG